MDFPYSSQTELHINALDNENNANHAKLYLNTYAGSLGFRSGYDANTSADRYAQLINTTPYNLKIIDDQVEIVHSDVNAQNITNGYYVLGLQHLDGGTGKQPGLAFTRSGGRKIGAIELYVKSSYNNCYMDFCVLDGSTNNLTMRLKSNGNTELYNDLDMNGNDVEQVESVYFNLDNAGRIYYNGSLDTMGFYTNNALALTIESNGVLVRNSNHDMNNAYRVINCLDPTVDQDAWRPRRMWIRRPS